MPTYPLLILPKPEISDPPKGRGGGNSPRFPSKEMQISQFGPEFNRLRSVLDRSDNALELRENPIALAPERVIVFEIAGSVENFQNAVKKIKGLEFLSEYETEFDPDDRFSEIDKRKGKEGLDRTDKKVSGRFYLTLPDINALNQLVRLWDRWSNNKPLSKGFTPFSHLFTQLRTLRPWGPLDRIPDETISYWQGEVESNPNQAVRTEIELWFQNSEKKRKEASLRLKNIVEEIGGIIIHEAVTSEIAYHGALIDIPVSEIEYLINRQEVKLALADDIMFIRPQSMVNEISDIDTIQDETIGNNSIPYVLKKPIAALLDGVPIQAHSLLAHRIIFDDPNDLQSRAIVRQRVHGTAMASLIIHGDLNEIGPSIQYSLYVQPLMTADDFGGEYTDKDRLLVDTLYHAVMRIKGSESQEASAPSVFIINLSIGDRRRPFTGIISPLARLIDYLSYRYNILFIVSGGNILYPLYISDFDKWSSLEKATPYDKTRAVIKALNDSKYERSILSPAESLNSLTIGAQHSDNMTQRPVTYNAIDPFDEDYLPNVSSSLGLGYHRMIKPDLFFPGGREYIQMKSFGEGIVVSVGNLQGLYGLRVAAPDQKGGGDLTHTAYSNGTSSATALITRSAHLVFDALMNGVNENGPIFADIDPIFYAVVVKCLLVHSAKWNENAEKIKEICGPIGQHKYIEQLENISRFFGFGVPKIAEAIECSSNRATMVGVNTIFPDKDHLYNIPLPECLEKVTDPRLLTLTIAWFSPINSGSNNYRCASLEAEPLRSPVEAFGVKRLANKQPNNNMIRRGSLFHEHYFGKSAVPFIDNGHLVLRVFCKTDKGINEKKPIRYAFAVTIQSENLIPIYEQIKEKLIINLQTPA